MQPNLDLGIRKIGKVSDQTRNGSVLPTENGSAERKPELLLPVEDEDETVACSDGDVGGGRRAGHGRRQACVDPLTSGDL